jgi:hypothetical protein
MKLRPAAGPEPSQGDASRICVVGNRDLRARKSDTRNFLLDPIATASRCLLRNSEVVKNLQKPEQSSKTEPYKLKHNDDLLRKAKNITRTLQY